MLHVGVCCTVVSVPCSLEVTCWERADLLAVVLVMFYHFPKYILVRIRIKGEAGAVKLVKALLTNILLTVPRRFFFCGSFMGFLSCVCYAFVRVCLYVHCGHLLGKG